MRGIDGTGAGEILEVVALAVIVSVAEGIGCGAAQLGLLIFVWQAPIATALPRRR